MKKSALERYAAKRTFSRTPEPPARAAGARHGSLLFVVQKHSARQLHYDFRLELDGVLKSWAVPKGPSSDPADKRMAVEVEDHPFDYGSFEGVIPAGQYGAGSVIVWDCGAYSPDEGGAYDFDEREAAQRRLRREFAAGKLSIFLCGEKLKGSYTLVRTAKTKQWLLIKHRDRFAHANDLLARADSVLSQATVEQVASRHVTQTLQAAQLAPEGPAERAPRQLKPMLAETGSEARTEPGWAYEPKLDGYRVIAFLDHGQVRLASRRGLDLTPHFPEVVEELAGHPAGSMVLDGEIVVIDASGRPSFNALQNRAQLKAAPEIERARRESPAVMVCFDLLHFGGVSLRQASYADRHRYLCQCLLPGRHLQAVHRYQDARELYDAALDLGFEGIMAKRLDSAYEAGKRSRAWLKIKAVDSGEFVIGGYTRGKGARDALGALLLGYYEGKSLRYAGHVGSGLDERVIAELLRRTAKLKRDQSPFCEVPPLHRPTTWLEPLLVAEVSFSEWTKAGALRAPVFLRLRDDMKARKVAKPRAAAAAPAAGAVRARRAPAAPADAGARADEGAGILEQLGNPAKSLELRVAGARIKLTNLDRVYWPATGKRGAAVTKRDLLSYLAQVAPYMLPHLKDRPLTMIRMPEGIGGERFFQ
ncbi:MAG TPA: non-homologous end-joining DNA ligase, partial [Steroidobacteraceae bacterium]|nr:non-homologous end-joining DNA ligase [Steroidobacteraceae bacterium]